MHDGSMLLIKIYVFFFVDKLFLPLRLLIFSDGDMMSVVFSICYVVYGRSGHLEMNENALVYMSDV